MNTPARRAREEFARAYGRPADVVWTAPGRVNLIGEHTDYNDGFVLPFALPAVTAAAVAPTPDGAERWRVRSVDGSYRPAEFGPDELVPAAVTGWAGYAVGVVWALREAGHAVGGADVVVASDVPVGAGLSSSAALECAVLGALCDAFGVDLAVEDRPGLAQRAENVYVGAPTGILDQSASVRCTAGNALFLDCRTGAAEQVPLDLAAAGLTVLIVDTRAPHRHVDGEYAARRADCERAAAELGVPALRDVDAEGLGAALAALDDEVRRRRVRHVVTENDRVLRMVESLRSGLDPARLGALLSESHASMRDDYEITVAEVDLAAATAEKAGAHGARMTGGGFGGCVIALCRAEGAEAVGREVTAAFAEAGYRPPELFTVTPSAGAAREG